MKAKSKPSRKTKVVVPHPVCWLPPDCETFHMHLGKLVHYHWYQAGKFAMGVKHVHKHLRAAMEAATAMKKFMEM